MFFIFLFLSEQICSADIILFRGYSFLPKHHISASVRRRFVSRLKPFEHGQICAAVIESRSQIPCTDSAYGQLPGCRARIRNIQTDCFPPHEACSYEHMLPRIAAAPDLFWVAVDKGTGQIAGFINGLATNENAFRDEFFTDAGLHDPDGSTILILGLDVLPQYRMHGLARELVRSYAEKETGKRKRLVLTCLENLVGMYQKFGFSDAGESASVWGGERWHEMVLLLPESPDAERERGLLQQKLDSASGDHHGG